MTQLRPYQATLKAGIGNAWRAGARNVLAVSPTGSGKTVLFADMLQEYRGASAAIAHRQELVGQISLALARNDVPHGLVAPTAVARAIVAMHMDECGMSYYSPNARCRVAGVDTLARLKPGADPWLAQVGLWVQDEAHHLLTLNKWGKAIELFPNAYGLGVTATPTRADGKGLGRHADGVFEAMVLGPTMRELIDAGYLTEYRIFAPPSDLDLSDVGISAGGDYSPEGVRAAVHRSHVMGDVVEHYLRIAPGKLGVTFAVDVEAATEICAAFRARGVPAEVVTSKTPDTLRRSILKRFARREVLQLVNVDLFGEGFDLPAIEVVSFARPTMSYALYVQQFGRALRLLEGKAFAIIIDHVGNVMQHGLPDAFREWSLDRRERRGSGVSDAIPTRACPQCTMVYERVLVSCPYCGHTPEPAGRSTPAQVDGDLCELSPEVLARMRGQVDAAPTYPAGKPEAWVSVTRHHEAAKAAQLELRQTLAMWGGLRKAHGDDERVAQRRFFHRFGIDVLSAQALNARDSEALRVKVEGDLQ